MNKSQDLVSCKFSLAENQKKVIWELTNTCNYACDYCIFASNGQENPHELTFDEIKNTLVELKKFGFNYIKFTGGEPFLRNDILDIFKICESLEIPYDVSTNASLLSHSILQELENLKYLSFLHISLDGFDKASHEAVRGAKTWEKTLNGLTLAGNFSIKKRVGCVLHTENYLNVSAIIDFLESMHVDTVAFSLMQPAGRMNNNDERLLNPNQLQTAINLIEETKKKSPLNIVSNLISSQYRTNKCPGGDSFLFIDSIGVVSPCTWVSDKDSSYLTQSLKEKAFSDILNSPLFISFRQLAENSNACPAQSSPVKIIDNKFSKFYVFSNENLNYLPVFEAGSKVATAGSSIDQAFSFILNGADFVEIVDINPKAKFFMELKVNALMTFSNKEFLSFFTEDMSYLKYKKVRPDLSANSQKFWDTEYLLNAYKSLLGTELFIKDSHVLNKEFIPYLQEKNYEALKRIDPRKKLCFQNIDLLKEGKSLSKFNLLYLSNIPDYSHTYFKQNDYIAELFSCIKEYLATQEKVMFYVYDIYNKNNSDKRNILNNANVRKFMAESINCNLDEKHFDSIFTSNQKDALCIITKKV